MLVSRLKVVILIIPIGIAIIALGGWPYTLLVTALLAIAAWEYWRLFNNGGYTPSVHILVGGVGFLALSRAVLGFEYSGLILTTLILLSMAYHTFKCEGGCPTPAVDFTITLAGLFYLGWLGSYLISLRYLPQGLWWVLLTIPAIWIGDAGAYLIGRNFGKHKLAPRVSPNKTIEGYFGGLVFTTLGGLLLAALWRLRFPELTLLHGLVIGAALGVLAPFGDLGESMLKRQFKVKDTSQILPGHGGILDRMDSWLWGAAISFYLITKLW